MSERVNMEGGGLAYIREDGGRVRFRCEGELRRDGIYKVWVRGDGGELLLGTMVPEGDRLVLERVMGTGELRRCGCWPVRSLRCRLAWAFPGRGQSGWQWEEHPERLVDAETARVGAWERMLLCRSGAGFELAVPLRRQRPLPLTALFCLARWGKIGGELCIIWSFDEGGSPCFPG